jgi:hypothetical protein
LKKQKSEIAEALLQIAEEFRRYNDSTFPVVKKRSEAEFGIARYETERQKKARELQESLEQEETSRRRTEPIRRRP